MLQKIIIGTVKVACGDLISSAAHYGTRSRRGQKKTHFKQILCRADYWTTMIFHQDHQGVEHLTITATVPDQDLPVPHSLTAQYLPHFPVIPRPVPCLHGEGVRLALRKNLFTSPVLVCFLRNAPV